MPHYPHYSPPPPPYRPSPPPPPPPPPVPKEVLDDSSPPGKPRCYFCGRLIPREEDVRKTEYHVGHGQTMFVMICPVCTQMKARGEGPFRTLVGAGTVLAIVLALVAFLLFMVFVVFRPTTKHEPPRLIDRDRNRPAIR